MDWNDLLTAFALYLVLEGVLPFLVPQGWRESILQLAKMNDRQLRIIGFISMCAGAILLAFVRA